jgi:hypothetical protein
MRKTLLAIVVLLTLCSVLPIACRKEESAPAADSAVGVTGGDTAATQQFAGATGVTTGTMVRLTGTSAPPSGSVVRVDFHNLICDFLQTTPAKAAFFNDPDHTAVLRIMQPTAVEASGPASEASLKAAFGGSVTAACDTESCTVFPLDGFTLRVIDGDDHPIQPSLTYGGDYDLLVPHLQKIAKVAVMNPKANDKVPSADFRTFFHLDGGVLTAKPYCAPLTLKQSDGTNVTIPTAEVVTVIGTSAKPSRLEVTKDGTNWSKVEFKGSSQLVWLILDNHPNPGHENASHFGVHAKAGDGTSKADFPTVVAAPKCTASTLAACGNTQWP